LERIDIQLILEVSSSLMKSMISKLNVWFF
jgi:hypothetical protein